MKRVLIIGASGFTSKYLYDFINSPDKEIFFCDLVNAFDKKLLKKWYKTDFSDFKEAYRIISEINPDQIYNLAGSFSNDFETDYRNNVLLTKNIFDSILKLNINTRVLIIGSAAEYGAINIKDNPIKEDYKLNPVSIYGLTKVFQTNLMTYYFNSKKINVVMVRTFNLIGKEIHKKLFIGSLFKQISEYKEKKINKIIVGNLDNKRDYIKIEDAVKKYEIVMENGKPGEIYNVGSGKSICIKELLLSVLGENNLSMNDVEVRNFDSRYDVKDIYADISKIKNLENLL